MPTDSIRSISSFLRLFVLISLFLLPGLRSLSLFGFLLFTGFLLLLLLAKLYVGLGYCFRRWLLAVLALNMIWAIVYGLA